MDSTPHYGKLDHGVRKGTTLPGTVIPPTGDEYGKLDRVCTCTTKYMYIYMYIVTFNRKIRSSSEASVKPVYYNCINL